MIFAGSRLLLTTLNGSNDDDTAYFSFLHRNLEVLFSYVSCCCFVFFVIKFCYSLLIRTLFVNCGIKWSHPSLDWNCRATVFAWEHIRIVLLAASWLIGCLRMKKHLQGNLTISFLSDCNRTAYNVQAFSITIGPFSKCCDIISDNLLLLLMVESP